MAEIFPLQKWLISYFWEHFLVPEHRIPIWLIFKLGFSVEDIDPTLQNDGNSLGFMNILRFWINHDFAKPLFL